jgi:hypothetical protein
MGSGPFKPWPEIMQRDVFSIIAIAVISSLLALILLYTDALVPMERALADLTRLPTATPGADSGLPRFAAAQVLLVLLAGVLMAWWATSITNVPFLVLFLLIAAAEWLAFKPLLAQSGIHYAASPALLALLLSASAGIAWQHYPPEKKRRRLLQIFAPRVSPDKLQGILSNPPLLDTPTPATVLLVQLPGPLKENTTPGGASEKQESGEGHQASGKQAPADPTPGSPEGKASGPLEIGREHIQNHHGLVLREESDRLLAFFGGYQPDEDHALHAAQCVLTLCRAFPPRNPHTLDGGEDLRIALECGEVVPRILDAPAGPDLQLRGQVTGIVPRLHRACELFPVRVLAGPKIQQVLASEGLFRPVELVRFGATESPREIYQLIGLRDNASSQLRQRVEDFWKGVIFFREGELDKAHAAFLEAQPLEDGDALVEYYLRRLKKAYTEDAETRAGRRTPRHTFII